MSQIETAVNLSRKLETLLEERHHATGKGLHEKLSSVEEKLPSQLVKTIRYIATMRNSVVHQDGFVIEDLAGFTEQGDAAISQLGGAPLSVGAPIGWFANLQFYLSLTVVLSSAIAAAVVTFKVFGGIGSVVVGLIGGAFLGVWVVSVTKKVLEFLLGLFILICALGVVGAVIKLASSTQG